MRPITDSDFWEKYQNALQSAGIAAKHIEWYKRHVQWFINKNQDVSLKNRTHKDIVDYFCGLSNSPKIQEWQYSQALEAMRILYSSVVEVSWAKMFPWAKWQSPHLHFKKELELHDHAYVPPQESRSSEPFKDVLEGTRVQEEYGDELKRLTQEIRTRHYSIRTEQSYGSWVKRFIAFHDCRNPQELGAGAGY